MLIEDHTMQHAQHALNYVCIGLGIAKGDLHGYRQRTLCR